MCLSFLWTAQMLYALASEHHADGRIHSEYMEVQRATHYMKEYRRCIRKEAKENR